MAAASPGSPGAGDGAAVKRRGSRVFFDESEIVCRSEAPGRRAEPVDELPHDPEPSPVEISVRPERGSSV